MLTFSNIQFGFWFNRPRYFNLQMWPYVDALPQKQKTGCAIACVVEIKETFGVTYSKIWR